MSDDESKVMGLFLLVAFVFGMGFGGLTAMLPAKVERIHSPSGLIVITPEGKKVFIPDSAISMETPGK